MRRLMPWLTLIRKEWRDVRAVSIVCALLVPIALLAMNEGFLDWRGDVGAWFVPVVTVLYVAVVASDLIAADVASGRAASYAALPVRASTLWASKVAFLVLAAGGFLAWTLAVTCGLHELRATPDALGGFWSDLANNDWRVAVLAGAGLVSAVVLWSTVLERGIAVVGAALVTCAVIGGLVPLVAWYDRELLPEPGAVIAAACALPVVLLAGSLVGFVRAPHHASGVLRRMAVALVVPLAVLLPTGAVSAAVLLDRLDVELGDPDVQVAAGHVSPDGRYLPLLGAKTHRYARARTWILDLEDGDVVALPQRGLQVDWDEPWNTEGHYVAWTTNDGGSDLRREYDPETGAILRTRSADQVNATRSWPSGSWATSRRDGGDTVITMSATGNEVRVPRGDYPRLCRIPGFVLTVDRDGVRLHDLNTGTSTVLQALTDRKNAGAWFSPGGEYVQVWSRRDRRYDYFATRTGAPVALPEGSAGLSWSGGGASDHYAFRYARGEPTLLIDLRTGWTTPLSPDPNAGGSVDVRVLGPDRLLTIHRDGRIEVTPTTGGASRTVLDPRRR